MAYNWKEVVQRKFAQHVDEYDHYAFLQKEVAEMLAAELPALEGTADILEVGCGTGYLTQEIFEKYPNAHFTITDLCQKMVDATTRKYPHDQAIYKVMDGEHPETDKQYDLIVSSMSVQWFEDEVAGLERLQKLLKPGGKLFYTAPGPESFHEWETTITSLGYVTGTLPFKKPQGIYHEYHYTIKYFDTFSFLKSIRNIGASHPKEGYPLLTVGQLKECCRTHDKNTDAQFTWHILYGCLEAL